MVRPRRAVVKPCGRGALVRRQARLGRFGESLGMLHAKILVVDRARVFISSLNFDGRSERYNTELGVLIESPDGTG